jgi:hypothetical protein
MVVGVDWYDDTEQHLFDDVERAADAAAEEVLEEDRALRALLSNDATTQPEETP